MTNMSEEYNAGYNEGYRAGREAGERPLQQDLDRVQRGIREAIDDLRRYQYGSDIESLRHEIDMVISSLQRL